MKAEPIIKVRPGCRLCRFCGAEKSVQGITPHEANCTYKQVVK